ncbi:MAG: hypothetical protein ACTSQB_04585 [Candidatus Heimdallarchaeota archaeon]
MLLVLPRIFKSTCPTALLIRERNTHNKIPNIKLPIRITDIPIA